MSQLVFDDEIVEQLEVLYRSRDVLRRRKLVYDALDAQPGDRILDAGCGPGFYTRELLDKVGPNGSLVSVDRSAQMLAVARRRCEGHANVAFEEADVTDLPVESEGFDRALSVQVLGSHDVEAWAEEQRTLGARGEFYFACLQFCFSATRPR